MVPDPALLIDHARSPVDDLDDGRTVVVPDSARRGRHDTPPGTCGSELLRQVRYGRTTARDLGGR